jgi:ribosomal protein S18 acetylase RimI-like enzyme
MAFNHVKPFVRLAAPYDIDAVKRLADAQRHELGFVVRASFLDACQRGSLFVATLPCTGREQPERASCTALSDRAEKIVGFVQAHYRRDGQTTLHTIAVDAAYRRRGLGRALVTALLDASRNGHMRRLLLRCPVDLAANGFYARLGFRRAGLEVGKRRELAVWVYELSDIV